MGDAILQRPGKFNVESAVRPLSLLRRQLSYRGEPFRVAIASFVPGIGSPISLIHALQRLTTFSPAPPVPSHPREGGARLSAFLFLHMCLEGVVQEKHQSSPHRFAEPPFQGWLSPSGGFAAGFLCSRFPSFIPTTFRQSASFVPQNAGWMIFSSGSRLTSSYPYKKCGAMIRHHILF